MSNKFINKKAVRQFALDYADKNRCQKYSRCSQDFLDAVEGALLHAIRSRVMAQPSKGKTLT